MEKRVVNAGKVRCDTGRPFMTYLGTYHFGILQMQFAIFHLHRMRSDRELELATAQCLTD